MHRSAGSPEDSLRISMPRIFAKRAIALASNPGLEVVNFPSFRQRPAQKLRTVVSTKFNDHTQPTTREPDCMAMLCTDSLS